MKMKTFHQLFNEITSSARGKEVAATLGTSPSYVTQIRKGDQIPKDELIAVISQAFAPDRLPELLLAALVGRHEKRRFGRKELKASVDQGLLSLSSAIPSPEAGRGGETGRTLADFPEAFCPLCVVTGDKREDRGAHISVADFGAYTATPADTRWIANLGLPREVVKHIDKNFLLLRKERLIERFAETNLLVIGSPAANHLARLINRSALFRFNYSSDADSGIEEVINKARGLTRAELPGYYERDREELKRRMRALFTGGIFDPTHRGEYVAAKYAQMAGQTALDFGVLTFAANPYYQTKRDREGKENDHRFVAIMAAGIHHPATAHAVRQLGRDQRDRGVFARHPYGGVLRVVLDLNVPFAERTEVAQCLWEDEADSSRQESSDQKAALLKELKRIEEQLAKGGLKNLELTAEQALACRELIEKL